LELSEWEYFFGIKTNYIVLDISTNIVCVTEGKSSNAEAHTHTLIVKLR